MNITFSADPRLIEKARAAAQARGTTLNELIRQFMADLSGEVSREEAAELYLRASSSVQANPDPHWRFNRDEIHGRRGQ